MELNAIFGLLLLVAVLGVIVYFVQAKIPMNAQFRWLFDLIVWGVVIVIGVVVILYVVIFLLGMVGIHPRLPGRVG